MATSPFYAHDFTIVFNYLYTFLHNDAYKHTNKS